MVTTYATPTAMAMKFAPLNVKCNPSFVPLLGFCAFVACPKAKSTGTTYQERKNLKIRACPRAKSISITYQERKILTLRGGSDFYLSGASAPFSRHDGGFARRKGKFCTAATSKKNEFEHPAMTSKPRWWLRSLACVPYLIPLHEAWQCASQLYRLHPFMENFEYLAEPFLVTYQMLPRWFVMVAFFAVYYLVGRRKDLPHFLRFHIFLALLLMQAVGGIGLVCGWLPGVVFKGRLAYLWGAFAFVEMLTVLHCMQCSLRGMYSDVPFISDSTYINLSM